MPDSRGGDFDPAEDATAQEWASSSRKQAEQKPHVHLICVRCQTATCRDWSCEEVVRHAR